MRERQWDKFGAAAGLLAVGVFVVAILLTGAPPKPEDADAAFKAFMVDKRTELLAQAWLLALAGFLFLWFAGAVRSLLRRVEAAGGHLANVFFGAVVVVTASIVVGAAVQSAYVYKAAAGAPPAIARFVFDLGGTAIALGAGFGTALAGAALIAVVIASGVLPRWLAGLTLVAVVANLVGTFLIYGKTGFFSLEGAFGFIVFGLTAIWIAAVSITVLQQLRKETAAAA